MSNATRYFRQQIPGEPHFYLARCDEHAVIHVTTPGTRTSRITEVQYWSGVDDNYGSSECDTCLMHYEDEQWNS